MAQAQIITTDAGYLYLEDQGSGAAVVFLHGFSLDSRMWQRQLRVFARGYRVLAYDALGYGRSGLPAGPVSPVSDLKQVLTCCSIDRCFVVAHSMAGGMNPTDAVAATLPRLEGAFALAFLFKDQPDLMIAARHGSPLAIGWGEDEMFVGSDALALSPMTSRITYLDEGDWAVVTRTGAQVFNRDGQAVKRSIKTVEVESSLVDSEAFCFNDISCQVGREAKGVVEFEKHIAGNDG